MSAPNSRSLCFWLEGGLRQLHFGHLHGTPVDLALIAQMPTLHQSLLAEPPALRIAVVARGKLERLLVREQVASLLSMRTPLDPTAYGG